ncbi:MAG: glycine C-acetyltransferase, partial [SAR202 cluster bacterium]|nr:glycine C-acetyltransferase [SAR202 cluster bacterium]
MQEWLDAEMATIRDSGLYKDEIVIQSPQGPEVKTDRGNLINFCANNYLGLANSPEVKAAVADAMKSYGYGMASVRFICGTQDIHRKLEAGISDFLGMEDTILYTSCFDANTGLFETILGKDDAIISDGLNHASIIDGVRLCKAQRYVYRHADMAELEARLQEAKGARFRMVATDGVFSMQGDIAPLKQICDLADKYDALVMVDDSHATAFLGEHGRGSPEVCGVEGRIDVLTSTLGKALGGAQGGFTTGRKEIVAYLRQRSRTYLFSNSIAPPLAVGALKALDIARQRPELRKRLMENTKYFRAEMTRLGFNILPGIHPIVPVMIGDEKKNV